jgi:hypothetical protein
VASGIDNAQFGMIEEGALCLEMVPLPLVTLMLRLKVPKTPRQSL